MPRNDRGKTKLLLLLLHEGGFLKLNKAGFGSLASLESPLAQGVANIRNNYGREAAADWGFSYRNQVTVLPMSLPICMLS
jgi:hypothetical protein